MQRAQYPPRFSFSSHKPRQALAWVVLVVSLASTMWGWYASCISKTQAAGFEFHQRSNHAITDIGKQLRTYEQVLTLSAGMLSNGTRVTTGTWRNYVDHLNAGRILPGLQHIAFAEVIVPAAQPMRLAIVHQERLASVGMDAEDAGTTLGAMVNFGSSGTLELQALDFAEMLDASPLWIALERARDSGSAALGRNAKFSRENDNELQAGFLMYLPVYRGTEKPQTIKERQQRLIGYLCATVGMQDFLRNTLDDSLRGIRIKIFDGIIPAEESLLYQNNGLATEESTFPFTPESNLKRAGFAMTNLQIWTVMLEASPATLIPYYRNQEGYVAAIGTLVSLLLFGITQGIIRRRHHARATDNTRTVSVRDDETPPHHMFELVEKSDIAIDHAQNVRSTDSAGTPAIDYGSLNTNGLALLSVPKRRPGCHGRCHKNASDSVTPAYVPGKQDALWSISKKSEPFSFDAFISKVTRYSGHLGISTPLDVPDRDRTHAATSIDEANKTQPGIAEHVGAKNEPSMPIVHCISDRTGPHIMLDITERKAAQTELERSHRDLQKLIAALETLREDEQKRLAQEMHDDLGQLLAAMKMDLANLQQRLPQGDAQLLQQLGGIQELVDAMVASVRRIIADLPPKILEDMGLFPALALLTANFEKRHHILCRLDVPKPEPEVDARIAAPVYRIVQESLNNIAKHAGATQVDVRINFYDNHLVMCVIDDGRGMGMDSLQKPGSFGLIGMRERVTALDGDLTIESSGEGTEVQIVIPLSPATV
jgi:signal transduction histidine kinase